MFQYHSASAVSDSKALRVEYGPIPYRLSLKWCLRAYRGGVMSKTVLGTWVLVVMSVANAFVDEWWALRYLKKVL